MAPSLLRTAPQRERRTRRNDGWGPQLARFVGALQALAHYHTALSLSPHSVNATRGLDRLEKTMRGVEIDTEPYTSANEDEASFESAEYMR